MLLLSLSALADPAPPAVVPPLGITVSDGALDVPVDVAPLLVYPSNAILPDTLDLESGGTLTTIVPTNGGPSLTPTSLAVETFSPNTTYTLSDTITSVTFTTGTSNAPAPADAPSLATATLALPGGETGSGFYWGVEGLPDLDETLVIEVDGEPLLVVTPEMSRDVTWSRPDDTTPFCVAARVRNAAGVLSDPGEPLCFGPPPTDPTSPTDPSSPTEPTTGPPTETPEAPGCNVSSRISWWPGTFARHR